MTTSLQGRGLEEVGRFGELLGQFRVRRIQVILYTLFGVALLVLGLAGIAMLLPNPGRGMPSFYSWMIAAALCGGGGHLLRQAYWRGRFRVLVCREALVRRQGGQIDALPWGQIARVRWVKNPRRDAFEGAHKLILESVADAGGPGPAETRITAGSVSFARAATSHPAQPHRASPEFQPGFTFDGSLARLEALREAVEERTLPHLLPAALEAYRAGEVLHFGDVRVSREGLHCGEDVLPWQLFESAKVSAGWLNLYSRNSNKLFGRVDLSCVPNAHVLVALADHLRTGA